MLNPHLNTAIYVYLSDELYRMCRDILNSCIRNTEEAEKSTQSGLTNGSLGKSTGKGVWSMIEESELARSIRLGEGSKVNTIFESCVESSPDKNCRPTVMYSPGHEP